MKIEPKSAPALAAPEAPSDSSQAARARAIARLSGNAQQEAVANPSNVSPEEMSAVRAPSEGQKDNDVTTQEAVAEVTETQEEPKSPPAKVEDPLSSQYAVLARKEKALRSRIQDLKTREDAIKAREDAAGKQPSFDESKYIPRERLKAETLQVLAEEGVSYDELTQAILNQNTYQQDPQMKAALARLEAQIKATTEAQEQANRRYVEQQEQSYKQAVTQIRTEAKQLVYTDPNFEMIKETNSVGDVVDLIEKTFKQDGVLLSVEEAAQAVEDYLTEEAIKISKIKKLQQKLGQSQSAKPTAEVAKQPQTGMKTLTNAVGAQKPLSNRDRAIAAFKGQLK